jgi:Tfp pilus assembly PilM family ATPase
LPRFLALDWDHQQLHIVAAAVKGGRVHIQRAAAWKEDQSPNLAEAEALGKLLRQRLKDAGIAAAPVLACVGRDRVIVKEVRYPPVPAAEETAVVRFQVAKELTDAADEVVIDYVAVRENGAAGEPHALALVVRRELLAAYETLCRAAGLRLAALTPRPFGTLACWKQVVGATVLTPHPEPVDAAVALLNVTERGAEFCVVRGDRLLLARSLAAGNTLAGEVRRSLSVYAGQSPQQPVRAIYVAGGNERGTLCNQLHQLLGIPVYPMDPFAGLERPEIPATNRGGFASAVGLLHARAERRGLPINFAQPKQPKPPRDANKTRLVAAASIAAVLLVGAIFFCYSRLAAKDSELEALFVQKTSLERRLLQVEEDAVRIKALDEWTQAGIVWLDEIYDLTERFPDDDSIRLTLLTGDPLTRTAQNRYVAKMAVKGITIEDLTGLNHLMHELVRDGHYRVLPKEVSPNRGGGQDRFRYRQQFTTRVDLEKQPPTKYVLRLPALPEKGDRNRNGRRNGEGRDFFGRGDR